MFCEVCGTVLNPDMECVNCEKKRTEVKEKPIVLKPTVQG